METIIKEHGQTILGIIFSILVMGLTAFTVLQLNKSMPVFNTDISNNNARFIEEMKTHSPSIEVDDLIYVDYESEFEIYNYVKVNDYEKLRELFGQLLGEIQRIKSEGDFEAARTMVETYAVKVDPELHKEVLARYEKLNLAPYKGFVNPVYTPEFDKEGNVIDVKISYTEGYAEQMLRYSKEYATLPYRN